MLGLLLAFGGGCGCAGLGTLGSVLGAALHALGDADGVQGAADDVVSDAGEILDAATADEDDGVLLEIVADAWDVRRTRATLRRAELGFLGVWV
jgi:hypothetical protein